MKILFCANWDLKQKNHPGQYAFFSHWESKPDVRLLGAFNLGPITRFEKKVLRFYILAPIAAFFMSLTKDVVIAYSTQVGLPLAFLLRLCFWRRIPLIVFDVESFGRIQKGPALSFIRFASKRIDRVVYAASGQREYYRKYLKHLVSAARYIPIGIGEYEKSRPLGEKAHGPIVAPGHHGKEFRDWATLLKAVDKVKPAQKFLIVGRTNLVDSDTDGFEARDNVSFMPFLPSFEFAKVVEDAPFVVLPLPERWQSLGQLTILFSMAMGKSVVATDVMGIRDYVEDGKTGLLTPPGDADALAAAMQRLLDNPNEATSMGVYAYERLQEKYRDKMMGRAWEKMVRELLEK